MRWCLFLPQQCFLGQPELSGCLCHLGTIIYVCSRNLAPGRAMKQTGRAEVASFMVQTGSVAWSDGGPGPVSKEELVFPPLQLTRTTASFLVRALLYNFQFVSPVQEILSETEQFAAVQWLVVADAAPANCKMLPHLFSFLREETSNSLAVYVPCLLHQMARILVVNLERQAVSSYSVWISSFP